MQIPALEFMIVEAPQESRLDVLFMGLEYIAKSNGA